MDDKEAVRRCWRLAAQGDADAQFNLGLMYAEGRGVPQDYKKAHTWFNISAANGIELASSERTGTSSCVLGNTPSEWHQLESEIAPRLGETDGRGVHQSL
jgi:TPR repeat protein